MEQINDTEDLKLLAGGSVAAFDRIYYRYSKKVQAGALRVLRSNDLAKDVVQDVFTTLWTKRGELTKVNNLKGYIATMGINSCYQHQLKLAKETIAENEFMSMIRAVENNDSPKMVSPVNLLNELDPKELKVLIDEAVAQLSPQQKQVFQLSKEKKLSYAGIAQVMQISPNTVKHHISAAYSHIRTRLQHHTSSSMSIVVVFIYLFSE